MGKDKEQKEQPRRVGSVAAEDDELTLWLNRLWARNEYPERVEVWQMFGRNKAVRGEMIFHEDFPQQKLDIEQANRLANEIIAAAQNDCDVLRKAAWFQIVVIDRNRKATPLTRRIGPLQPKHHYALSSISGADKEDSESDDEELSPQQLNRAYVKEAMEQARWDKQRYDRVMGEMLLLQHNIIQQQQGMVDSLLTKYAMMFEKANEAADRALDRELIREREKMKLSLMKDGFRTVRNLLPGMFAPDPEASAPNVATHGNADNGHANGHVNKSTPAASSPERQLVDNFLNDIHEDEILTTKLFGDFAEQPDGTWALVKPGIFSFEQYKILIGVRDGKLPVEKLDELLPQSGFPTEIKPEQVAAAGNAGVTESIGLSLLQLVALRNKAKEAKGQTSP